MAESLKRLHALVQALGPRERGQVRRTLQANKKHSAKERLFQALVAAREPDALGLAQWAQTEAWSLDSAVQGLTESILRVLSKARSRASTEGRLLERLAWSEVLRSKGLVDWSVELMARSRRLAEEEGHREAIVWSLGRQHWPSTYLAEAEDSLDRLEADLVQHQRLLDDVRMEIVTQHLARWTDIFLVRTSGSFAESCTVLQERVLAHPALHKSPPVSSTKAHYLYWDLLASVHFYMEDWQASRLACEQLYHNLRKQQDAQERQPHYQLAMLLTNTMLLANRCKDASDFRQQWRRWEAVRQACTSATEHNRIEAQTVPRAQLQLAWHAAIDGDRAGWQELMVAYFEPMLSGGRISEMERFQAFVDLSGMALYLRRYGQALAFAEQAKSCKDAQTDKERAYAAGWYGLLAAFGLEDPSVFESRLRSWSLQLRHGAGQHWPRERVLLTGLKQAFRRPAGERRARLQQARADWVQAFDPPGSTRHIDVAEALAIGLD